MILFTLAGLAVSRFLGIEIAVPVAIVLGLLVAPMIPAKSACSIRPPEAISESSQPEP